MTFYNMLFGVNGQADLLLAVVGLRKVDVERFLDVHAEDGGATIAVYTRTGGGNRPDYPQALLYKSPYFRSTEDDDFDTTYATFYFATPKQFVADVDGLSNPLANGIRKPFGKHLLKTLERAPTEADLSQAAHDREREAIKRLPHVMANGHTFVPLTDNALESALKIAEDNGGELRTAWGILPLSVEAVRDEVRELRNPKEGTTYKDWTRLGSPQLRGHRWAIDEPYWAHTRERFAALYPITMAKIAESVEEYRRRAA